MKVVAMIPARLGSQRVPKKNHRPLGDKPLISYAISAAIQAGCFDDVIVNSESDIIGEVATEFGATFYKRAPELANNEANNDAFLKDFCENTDADIVVQLLPTSPFISPKEIADFTAHMVAEKLNTLVSVQNHQIAAVFKKQGINFDPAEPHIPSQDMEPVSTYATVLMAWDKENFLSNMKEFGYGYHGVSGKIDYFVLEGFSTIDIDTEEEFRLAESVYEYLKRNGAQKQPEYYQGKQTAVHSESDVPSILKVDGIFHSDFEHENSPLVHIPDLIETKDSSVSWCHRLVNTESNSATLISQLPGEGNRLHYHPDWNEWWYIIDGEWIWEIDGKESTVKQGDFVFMPKNVPHKITATGNKPAIRLAVSRADVAHVYPEHKL